MSDENKWTNTYITNKSQTYPKIRFHSPLYEAFQMNAFCYKYLPSELS